MPMLVPGDQFPKLKLALPRGGSVSLPDDLSDSWAYILFYRGVWWGYCQRQLAAVEENIKLLKRLGIRVIAASTDPEAGARKVAADAELSFPVAYGVSESHIAAIGAWQGERRGQPIVQPTEFILRPGGEVAASLYGTTQLGRMSPREIAVFVKARQW